MCYGITLLSVPGIFFFFFYAVSIISGRLMKSLCSQCVYPLTSPPPDNFFVSYEVHVLSKESRLLVLPELLMCNVVSHVQYKTFTSCNWLLMMPSIATKFQYVNSPFFIFSCRSLHVSAPTGHPQVRYTIRCFQGLFLLQRIHSTYTT
jgi:hypothetical protein